MRGLITLKMLACEFLHGSKNGDATLPFLVFLVHFQGRAIVFAKRKIPALQSRQGAFVDKDSSNHNAKWKLATEARLATDIILGPLKRRASCPSWIMEWLSWNA
jgi:hypothetical protein